MQLLCSITAVMAVGLPDPHLRGIAAWTSMPCSNCHAPLLCR